VSEQQDEKIKGALQSAFDVPYRVRVEPLDSLYWKGKVARRIGSFTLADRWMQIEFPEGLISDINSNGPMMDRWLAGLKTALSVFDEVQEVSLPTVAWGTKRFALGRTVEVALGSLPVHDGVGYRYCALPLRMLPRVAREGIDAKRWSYFTYHRPAAPMISAGPDSLLLRGPDAKMRVEPIFLEALTRDGLWERIVPTLEQWRMVEGGKLVKWPPRH